MTSTVRMLPPAVAKDAPHQKIMVSGRAYSNAPGSTPIDIPAHDAPALQANGWLRIALSGPTSARPSGALGVENSLPGVFYFDTTLNKMVVSDGLNWRDPSTGGIV